MKQRFLPLIVILSLLVTGCDDDDGPVTPAGTATSVVVGNVILRPYVDFLASIQPIYAQDNEVDSAFFADSQCYIGQVYTYVPGNGYNWGIVYENQSDSLRFESGDTAEIVLYVDNTPVAVTVPLLDWEDDVPVFIEPSQNDSIDVGEDLSLTWHKVDGADWYGLELYFYYDYEDFIPIYHTTYYSTTDTTILFPGTAHEVDGYYGIRALAATGSVPGSDDHNVAGPTITGDIYGRSDNTGPLHVTVGNGLPEIILMDEKTSIDSRSPESLLWKVVTAKGD